MIFLEGGINLNVFQNLLFFLFFISPPFFLIRGFVLWKKNKENAIFSFILVFLAPLISFGLCLALD